MEYRKLIKFGRSSYVVSLPKRWLDSNKLEKGDVVLMEEQGNNVVVTTEANSKSSSEAKIVEINNLHPLVERFVYSLYKKGLDEVRINFNDPNILEEIHKAIGRRAIGYEIVDQGTNHCVIKHVSGSLEGFDQLLRRTFLLLIEMAEEFLGAIKSKDFKQLKNISMMEHANNRFTTMCRRYINKNKFKDGRLIGPLYYMIESLEQIADQYKYLCDFLHRRCDNEILLNPDVVGLYKEVTQVIKDFYEVFYKYDEKKIVEIAVLREEFMNRSFKLMEKNCDYTNTVIIHHLIVIMQQVFCLLGPYFVYKV